MNRLLALLLCGVASLIPVVVSAARGATGRNLESQLRFTPDPGIRVDNASNPAARVDESGKVILFYEDQGSHRVKVATATDGMKRWRSRPKMRLKQPVRPHRRRIRAISPSSSRAKNITPPN